MNDILLLLQKVEAFSGDSAFVIENALATVLSESEALLWSQEHEDIAQEIEKRLSRSTQTPKEH